MLGVGKVKWKSAGLGAGAVLFGPAIIRPVLVLAARAGMSVAAIAADAWQEAVVETQRIKAEAIARQAEPNSSDILTELRAMRRDLDDVKAKLAADRPH